MSENVVINCTFRIVQVPLIELCSMQSSGNTPYVPSGNAEREVVEPGVVQDEDAQASLAQAVDTADEKAQMSTEQTTDMEISKPSLDVQDENSSLGKQLMKLKSFW